MPGDKKGIVCQSIFDKGGSLGSGVGNVVCKHFPTIPENITEPLVNLANNINDVSYKIGESIGNGMVNTATYTSKCIINFNDAFGKAVLDDASRSFETSSHSDFMNNFNSSSNFNNSSSNDFVGKTSFGSSSGGFDFGSKF